MSDIVERLRAWAGAWLFPQDHPAEYCGVYAHEAADEIERLRVEATKLAVSERCAIDEIERLQAENEAQANAIVAMRQTRNDMQKRLIEIEAENADLRERLAKAERDAARYRWNVINGERVFGSLWREASIADIDVMMKYSTEQA